MTAIPAGWNDDIAYTVSERAYLLHTEGRYQESLILFQGLLDIYPGNSYYMDAIASLFLLMGKPEAAVQLATAVLKNDPSYVYAFVRRCEGYISLRMFADAEADIQQLRRLGWQNHAQRMAMRLAASRGENLILGK
jgi:tetratricopeptide (TPR) repeat protein